MGSETSIEHCLHRVVLNRRPKVSVPGACTSATSRIPLLSISTILHYAVDHKVCLPRGFIVTAGLAASRTTLYFQGAFCEGGNGSVTCRRKSAHMFCSWGC